MQKRRNCAGNEKENLSFPTRRVLTIWMKNERNGLADALTSVVRAPDSPFRSAHEAGRKGFDWS